jgi:hypothetical protein
LILVDPSGHHPLDKKWEQEYCAKHACVNGHPPREAQQDRLFSMIFQGGNADGTWNDEDWSYYSANREQLWTGQLPWKRGDSGERGVESFVDHLEKLSSHYNDNEKGAFVDAIGLFWAGLRTGGPIGAVASLYERLRFGPGDLLGFSEEANNMPIGFLDTEDPHRDQAHHYAGFVVAGYWIPAKYANQGPGRADDPNVNPGDVNLGYIAIHHGQVLKHMTIKQWVSMVRNTLTSGMTPK